MSETDNNNRQENKIGTCPSGGADVLWGKYGAYCAEKCGITLHKSYGHEFTKEEIETILDGEKTLVRGLVSREGKNYNAYLQIKGTSGYSFTNKDGEVKSGKQLDFEMTFPDKDDPELNRTPENHAVGTQAAASGIIDIDSGLDDEMPFR